MLRNIITNQINKKTIRIYKRFCHHKDLDNHENYKDDPNKNYKDEPKRIVEKNLIRIKSSNFNNSNNCTNCNYKNIEEQIKHINSKINIINNNTETLGKINYDLFNVTNQIFKLNIITAYITFMIIVTRL